VADNDSQTPIFWERLRNLFARDTEPRTPASGEPPNRGMVIASCLLISFTLWFTLTLRETYTATLRVPIEVQAPQSDRVLSTLPPSHADVRVQGEGLELLRLYTSPPSIPVEVQEETINLESQLNLERFSVNVESVTPRELALQTEPRVERRLPVRSRVTVETPPAHELIEPPVLQPDSVAVAGAQSRVEGLTYWPTERVTLTDVRDTVRQQVALADTLSRLVERSPEQVTVIARAGKFTEATREIEVEVTGVPSSQNLVTLEPSVVRVRYRVLFDQFFESKRAQDFFATVSYDQIRSDTTGRVEPRLHLPSGLIIRDSEIIPPQLRYYTFVSGE
jgi:hypothetical protein